MLSAELWVTLFVMESCRRRPLVGSSLYTKNHVLLLAWVTLADTFLEPEKKSPLAMGAEEGHRVPRTCHDSQSGFCDMI